MGLGQNQTTRGPQILVHVSIYQVEFWVPIFDPQPDKAVKQVNACELHLSLFSTCWSTSTQAGAADHALSDQ